MPETNREATACIRKIEGLSKGITPTTIVALSAGATYNEKNKKFIEGCINDFLPQLI